MEKIKKHFEKHDRYAAHNGIRLLEIREGYALAEMPIEPFHLNGAGIVHGAAVFTLGDLAFAAASNSRGSVAVGINVSISYMKAGVAGILRAEAVEEVTSNRLGQYTVRITDDSGALIALMSGMVYRKNEPLVPAEAKA
ncbi:MAG: PaaI family thioesterase [Kiritimatiellae bacterium]|nr:PaaI family thioesterase [Kiritimatiellia bacterium]